MARANLYSVLRHISVQCGLSTDNINEDSMMSLPVVSFANIKRPEVREKAFKLLKHNIPVLEQMAQVYLTQGKPEKDGKKAKPKHLEVQPEDVQKLLQNILRVVNFQRNHFTHADHYDTKEEIQNELKIEKSLYHPLECAFNSSKREVKRIYNYTAIDMNFVDQTERMKKIKMLDNNGNPILDNKGNERYIFVEQKDWYFRLFDIEYDPVTKMPIPQHFSTAGLVFLLCRLLHKRYASQLAQQSGLFRNNKQNGSSPFKKNENEVMFNIFCTNRIRLPKGRLESSADDSALGLDMLNELQKCPAELFETLSSEDKKLFQVKRKDNEAVPNPDDDINLFRRFGDRFPLLSLKYIDSMRNAKDIRDRVLTDIVFQVSLGKFRYKFYNRASLDTTEPNRVRVLQKEINGFGPINEIEKQRKEKYHDFIRPLSEDSNHLYNADTAQTKPYLTDQYAHYAITGNRIGITWNAKVQKPQGEEIRNSIRLKWNDGQMEKLDNNKCFLPNLPLPTENIAPRAWLSVHDLPGLIFLHILGGDPEAVIKDSYGKLLKLLKDVSDMTLKPPLTKEELEKKINGLHLRDVPKKIVDYLVKSAPKSEKDADKAFIHWANKQLDGTIRDHFVYLLRDIKNKRLKPAIQKEKKEVDVKNWLKQEYKVGENVPKDLKELRDNIVKYLLGDISYDQKNVFFDNVKLHLYDLEEERPTSLILKLEKDIKQFDNKLKTVGDKQNRPGTKGYVEVRPGALARYIAKDIMAMTKPDENLKNLGKPCGMDFDVLQSSIAAFHSTNLKLENTELGSILKKAININNHPFLNKVMNQEIRDTITLYQKYQTEKLKFLIELRKNQNYKEQWFLREAYRNQTTKTPEYMHGDKMWATRYLDTLQLPNGLFTDAIREKLAKIDNNEIKNALYNKVKENGTSHLLNAYFINVLNDNSQNFYRDMKRHYKLLDWAYFEQDPQNNKPILPTLIPPELYFTPDNIAAMLRKGDAEWSPIILKMGNISDRLQHKVGKRWDNFQQKEVPDYGNEGSALDEEKDAFYSKLVRKLYDLQRNERDIRRHRNQDMLLFLMAKKLLVSGGVVFKNKAKEDINQFLLKDIVPPAMNIEENRSILEQFVEFQLTINLNDENGKPMLDNNKQPIQRTIKQEKIKLKNYGDFYTFLYDSRIGSLLSQLPDNEIIDRDNLESELDSYDQKRRKVFAILQDIERIIIKNNPEVKNSSNDKFIDKDGKIRLNHFSGLLNLCKEYLKDNGDPNDVSELLVEIRNAFSHNRYVYSDNKLLKIKKISLPEVATRILRWLETQQKVTI